MTSETAFIGRRRELAVVERALSRCADSGTVVLEVSGEPGIGKTRLLTEIGVQARRRGHAVGSGRASEYEQTVAFAAFTDPLDELVRGIDAGQRLSTLTGLGPLDRSARAPDAAAGSLDILRAVRMLIERLAVRTPVVLVLDDLHWADPASVALLGYLLRRPPRAPVLLALAYRPAQASPALLATLGRADPDPVRVDLGPLAAAEADELLRVAGGSVPTRARRRAMYRVSGGNPFYLLALAELGRARAGPPADLALPSIPALPLRLRRVLLSEFAGLSEPGRLSASAAAVAGDVFDPELVGRVAGSADLDGFHEIVARDLVRPATGGCFRYRHPLLRHAAYHMSTSDWRVAAHRRAADVARERGLPAVARAPHVERYATAGDEDAIDVLVTAARVETVRAPAIAAHWLRAALRLVPERSEPPGRDRARRHALTLDLARAQGLAGDLVDSRATLHRVLPTMTSDQPLRLATVTFCAMVERLLGHHRQARALLLAEWRRGPVAPDRVVQGRVASGRAELAIELAAGALMRGDLAENRYWARRARMWATEADRGVSATAHGFVAMGDYADSDVSTAMGHLTAAAELVDAMPDGELAGQLGAALWLGWNEVYLERYHDAVAHLERGLAVARATGQAHLLPQLLSCLGLALRWLGRLDEASRHAEEAVDAADLTGSADLSALALAVQSWLASWVGDSALARTAGRAAVRACAGRRGWFTALATAMLARGRLEAGEPDGTAETIVAAFGGPELPTVDPRSRISWWGVVVRAEIAQGRLDVAEEYAARAENLADRIGLAGHRGHAWMARAYVLTARRDPAAGRWALAAAEAFEDARCPLEEGQAYLLVATATSSGSAAPVYLQRAGSLFEACGARGLVARAASLAEAGAGPPAGGAATLAGLTNRESQTAELVAEGITNREIARRLGISEKTVEKYVSSLLTKLGVAGRAAVASVVGRAQASQATRRSGRRTTSSPASS